MKTTSKLALAAIMAALISPIANAQLGLIYSNSFSVYATSPANSVYSTPPTVANTLMGGSASAIWSCTYTNTDPTVTTAGTLYQNGATTATNKGCALLPLTVQTNAVYVLSGNLTLPATMANDAEMGFTAGNCNVSPYWQTNIGVCRFNDNPPGGYAWFFNKIGSVTFFGGLLTAKNDSGGPGGVASLAANQTYNWEIILDTLNNTNSYYITNQIGTGATNYWISWAFINGLEVGTNCFYTTTAAKPTPGIALNYAGIGQSGQANVTWNSFTVSTPLLPLFVMQPVSSAAAQGLAFTNTALVLTDTNGGPVGYQWYQDNVGIPNATNSSLVINPITAGNNSTNYYLVAMNSFGAVTSSVVSMTVYTNPTFVAAFPITQTNPMTLFGSTNIGGTPYVGSSPTFSVQTLGAGTTHYQWYTNGVAVAGAITNSITFTNLPMGGPTNVTIIASNLVGPSTNSWNVQYIPTPTNVYPQTVLGLHPMGFWRLDDTNVNAAVDDGQGDNGYICYDFASGNNGIYTNVVLGQPGYSPIIDPATDPLETSAWFYEEGSPSCAYGIGTNIDFSGVSNAEFTVAVWAQCSSAQIANAGMVTKGNFNAEEFTLGCNSGKNVWFSVRNKAATAANANSSYEIGVPDQNWHWLVGVCDEANGTVNLYIDGVLQGEASIAPGSGIVNSLATPMMIGARTATTLGDTPYFGLLDDASVYGFAMTASNVATQWALFGGTVPAYFVSTPATTYEIFPTNTTLTIPASAFGTPPIGYNWIDVTAGTNLTANTTNNLATLNANIVLTMPTNYLNDQLELVVTNAYNTTNLFVTFFGPPPPPPAPSAISYTSPIIYSNSFDGGPANGLNGTPATLGNILVGGTNALWIATYTNTPTPSNGTVYANGSVGTNAGNMVVPFTPEPGFIYTMTASLTLPGSTPNWLSMGFEQAAYPQANNQANGRFTDAPFNGYAWMYCESSSKQAVFEPGARTGPPNGIALDGVVNAPGTNILQVILNTVTNDAWSASASINGTLIGTTYYNGTVPIAYAGIGQSYMPSPPNGIIWNYWSLTATAPNGFAPFAYLPLPTNNITVSVGSQVTNSANIYGTGPYGYYWTDTDSGGTNIFGSGVNATTTPVDAPFNIPSTTAAMNGDTLELVMTNSIGTNIFDVALTVTASLIPPVVTNSISGGNLILSWPSANTGWQLQAQTNSLAVGLTSNWFNLTDTTGTNSVTIPINLTNGCVFYRLVYP
ncbi:MAG TPA: hypothetical protein VH280_25275 [Verrucomicrobiae bacterium]|nr:hypothetical protein [Verrucomicrobiae bacterium]